MDKWSSGANRAIDILLSKHQGRTSMGAMLGVAVAFLVSLFSPVLSQATLLDFEKMTLGGWVSIGILLMHLPTIVSYLSTRSSGDESIDETLLLIDKGNFTTEERKELIKQLIAARIEQYPSRALTSRK